MFDTSLDMASPAVIAATALPDSAPAKGKTPLRFRIPDYTEVDAPSEDSSVGSDSEGDTTCVESGYADDNYVRKVLAKERPLPPM